MRVSFTFARSRPETVETPREVALPGDHFLLVEEATRLYRAAAPPEETEIRGAVLKLHRGAPTGAATGPVLVLAFVRGRARRIQITLGEADHRLAVQAYERGEEIVCTGDLVRDGDGWLLRNPKGFDLAVEVVAAEA